MNPIEQLRVTTKCVAGGNAWDRVESLHLRYKILQGGLSGISDQWKDVRTGKYSDSHSLGITAGCEGFDGKVPWSGDTAGYSRLEENGDSLSAAANIAYRTCLAWWYPERAGADHGWRESSANLLFGHEHFDPDSGAEALRGALCRVGQAASAPDSLPAHSIPLSD